MDLSLSIDQIWGIGPAYAKRLKKLGIETAQDLLFYFPRRYEDLSKIVAIGQIRIGEVQSVVGRVMAIGSFRTPRKKMTLVEAVVGDETGMAKAVWFNQPYLARAIKKEETIILSGKVEFGYKGVQFTNPVWERIPEDEVSAGKLTHAGRIVPIYPLTEGLTSRWLRSRIKPLLKLAKIVEEDLPGKMLDAENLPGIVEAINQIHFPDTAENFEKARERFALEELLILQLAVAKLKALAATEKAPKIDVDCVEVSPQILKEVKPRLIRDVLTEFVAKLPFKLTDAQRKAAWEIIKDLAKDHPMTRLLEGDVGSGKTVVAALAILAAVKAGYQAALMAPTGILAVQHYNNLVKLLEPFGVSVGLLTNEQSAWSRRDLDQGNGQTMYRSRTSIHKAIRSGNIDLVIGTHALISDDVKFTDLALAIIDEQHRFGVDQRSALIYNSSLNNSSLTPSGPIGPKGRRRNSLRAGRPSGPEAKLETRNFFTPHLLSMTATPIPRTLAMTAYGDLDLSVIDEMPMGRKKVISRVVTEKDKNKAYDFVRSHVKADRQVFVICPRIEEGFGEDVQSAKETYKKLSEQIFPDLTVGLLHGKLKPAEKEKVMADFVAGKISILVSTSVVEVGVDVPNATIMWIEGAERFGLAQLHQLRGRVGRSDKQSFCLLFSSVDSEEINYRLNLFASCNDGFKLAEEDMKMRGPGDMWGTRQSGFPELKIATLTDYAMVQRAKKWADILTPSLLSYPNLANKVEEFLYNRHRE